jgi:hypothetical protein
MAMETPAALAAPPQPRRAVAADPGLWLGLAVIVALCALPFFVRNFVVFHNQQTHKLAIMYRRKDGEYGLIEPEFGINGNGISAT